MIAEVSHAMALQAASLERTYVVAPCDPRLAVHVDRDTMLNALTNLLQNALKFTRCGGLILLNVEASGGSVRINVADQCGGLPNGDTDAIFESFAQFGDDRTGLGLGLVIARRSVEANGGTLTVRDMPGVGCMFTIEIAEA